MGSRGKLPSRSAKRSCLRAVDTGDLTETDRRVPSEDGSADEVARVFDPRLIALLCEDDRGDKLPFQVLRCRCGANDLQSRGEPAAIGVAPVGGNRLEQKELGLATPLVGRKR